jgi:hypothetical protein
VSSPPKRKRPIAWASSQNNNLEANCTAWWVIAVKPSGKRVPVGSCPTQEAAESWAAMLRTFSLPLGGDAFVERET